MSSLFLYHESTLFKFSLDVKHLFIILLNFIITGQFESPAMICTNVSSMRELSAFFVKHNVCIVFPPKKKKKGGGGGGGPFFFICFRTTVVNKWIDTVVSGLEDVSG